MLFERKKYSNDWIIDLPQKYIVKTYVFHIGGIDTNFYSYNVYKKLNNIVILNSQGIIIEINLKYCVFYLTQYVTFYYRFDILSKFLFEQLLWSMIH